MQTTPSGTAAPLAEEIPAATGDTDDELYVLGVEWDAFSVQGKKAKELDWHSMDRDKQEQFRAAMDKNWQEHLDNDAVELVPPDQIGDIPRDRVFVVPPRFLLTAPSGVPKARLVVPGHLDPDAPAGTKSGRKQLAGDILRIDAPVGPPVGLHIILSICSSKRWRVGAFDIKAAFF